jgi:tRNA pseudouridine13 synthase
MALEMMPRKFSAEISIIRHLGMMKGGKKVHENDWQGAIMSIQRNLRLMYVHAYQSLVWNIVAGRRWELFGDKVVEGDLIIDDGDKDRDGVEEVDELGEVIVRPEGEERATTEGDYTRARPLSKEEAESGRWTIFDIVLPLPGWDVIYPLNEVGEVYKEFMESERGGGLDPNDMRRKQKDFSLSGGYRKILARPESGMTWEVRTYWRENEQFVCTDLERLMEKERKAEAGDEGDVKREIMEGDAKLAVVLEMHLGASQYATMALRELMKAGGVKSYQANFGTGR